MEILVQLIRAKQPNLQISACGMKHSCSTWIQYNNCVLFNWSKSSLLIDKFAVKRTVQKYSNRKPVLEGLTNEWYTLSLKPSSIVHFQCGVAGSFLLKYKPYYITVWLSELKVLHVCVFYWGYDFQTKGASNQHSNY